MGTEFDDSELAALTDAWLRYQVTKDQADWWAADCVIDLAGQLDALWRVIQVLCQKVAEDDRSTISHIGAGPLEDMIRQHGDEAMDLIEPAIAGNPTLLKALACVWGWKEPTRPRVDRVLAQYGEEPWD